MLIFNCTDIPLELRDRVIIPKRGIEFASISSVQSLTPDEIRLVDGGVLQLNGQTPKQLQKRAKDFPGRTLVRAEMLLPKKK